MKKLEIKKVSPDDAQSGVQRLYWLNQFKVTIVTATITTFICATTYAADLEIYKIPEDSTGATTLMMMLDLSGSMAWDMAGNNTSNTSNSRLGILKKGLTDVLSGTPTVPRVDDKIVMGLSVFEGDNGRISIPAKALGEKTGREVQTGEFFKKPRWQSYNRNIQTGNDKKGKPIYTKTRFYIECKPPYADNYDCLSWTTETSNQPNGYKTTSPFITNTNTDCKYGDYSDCISIWENIPKMRDETHRDTLLAEIKGMKTGGGTPTAYAYAEAGAYMMGTTTLNESGNFQIYFVDPSDNYYLTCQAWNGNTCTTWGSQWTKSYPYSSQYTKTGSGRVGQYSGDYYSGAKLDPNTYSGWLQSASNTKNGNVYEAPASIQAQLGDSESAKAKKECSGQGIYFLTDGEPNAGGTEVGRDGKTGTAYNLMTKSLSTKGAGFSCANSSLGNRGPYRYNINSWSCIGNYARALLDPTKNPLGLTIKTVMVGFGSTFSGTAGSDVQDAKDWGTLGGGGWVIGTNSEAVVESINKFIKELNKDIPSMSTGSSTVPMDALNPEIIQPYAYFPQFEPKIKKEDTQQLWFGNVKKYYVVNNGVYSNPNGGATNTVVLRSKLQDLTDQWANSDITYPENTPIYKKGGALSQLLLGTVTTTNNQNQQSTTAGRKLLTDYVFDGTKTDGEQISRTFDLNHIDYTYPTNAKTRTDNASRVRGLMALLGYNINSDTATEGLALTNNSATLRQMGSVYHSLPILLTQEGKSVATRNATTKKIEISTTGRHDYVMFGTTQGLLSVVDAVSGVEKFSFVPSEMIERQVETFKENAGNLSGGKNALYYGMDGEWVAHTVYVTDGSGKLTVQGAVRNVIGSTKDEKENLNGKQWVYGGMRMGGRSYYSLDLTDINTPKLKFHIDPSTGKVYSAAHPEGKDFSAIENMGQSWSKPKLDYVNWKGKRKLVMFVGGGYDAGGNNGDGLWVNGIRTGYEGYENYNYQQDNKRGAGVYMFDADNGDLLWYADANADPDPETPASGSETSTTAATPHLINNDLKYSVVSEIKTVDRNNDGMVDHIYFGDLAGQAFRIDFGRSKDAFTTQGTKILNLHKSDGTSPRFYLSPVFTAHHSSYRKEGADVVVVSFISGNKSSPLLATTDSPVATGQQNSDGLQYDGVYAIYDYDIHPDGFFYPDTHIAARTLAATDASTASTSQLKYISNAALARSDNDDEQVKGAVANADTGWGGWYYRFDKKFNPTSINPDDRDNAGASIIKGLSPLIAMEGNLYVTMYDASNNGTSSSCGAGVKGHSFTQRLCLPTGVCAEDANYIYNLGAGIVSLNVGSVDGGSTKSVVVPDPDDIGVGCRGAACNTNQKFIFAGGDMRFIPNRWYERYAKAN